ncbi:putative anion transporter 6 [Nymphaea thermarum]|nr:putative anion transporter 6 [Nymphaea thermarum]
MGVVGLSVCVAVFTPFMVLWLSISPPRNVFLPQHQFPLDNPRSLSHSLCVPMASSLVQPRNMGFGCPQTLRPRRVPELSCFPSSSAAAAASPPPCRFRSSSFRGARVRASGHRGQGGGVAEEEVSPEVPVLRRVQDDPSVPGEASEASVTGGDWRWPPWKGLPQRYKLIGTTSLAFVICNMDKVNLSVAIIPMSHQFGWNSSTAGLVQSSFFWGYTLSQLPGGWLAKFFGGRSLSGWVGKEARLGREGHKQAAARRDVVVRVILSLKREKTLSIHLC